MNKWRDHFVAMVVIFSLSFSSFSSSSEGRPLRILTIDGGGVRGLIAAVVLEKMEKELGQPIAKTFDMVAGTSTGGILALALTAPNHMRQPVLTAQKAVGLYLEQSSHIFTASFSHWLENLGGLLGPKYELTGLKNILKKYLGDTKLSEALIPTLITGYHLEGQTGVEFFSEDSKAYPEDKDCLMRDVGLATSAAPVYFDLVDVQYSWGHLRSVADGAFYAHNPALVAYINAKQLYPGRKIEIYSLGTGHINPEEMNAQLKGRGLLQWLSPLLKHIELGGSDADHAVLHRLLNENGEENYFRLNVRVDRAHGSMDNASEDNLRYLYNKGQEAIESALFKEMIERLRS